MPLQQDAPRRQNAILRFLFGWKPATYRQVWLVAAPFVASGALIGGLAAALSKGGFATDRFLLTLPMAILLFAGRGAIDSYRLSRRRDEATYAEWLEARDRAGVE
jgi:hypothetical protein